MLSSGSMTKIGLDLEPISRQSRIFPKELLINRLTRLHTVLSMASEIIPRIYCGRWNDDGISLLINV